MRYTCVCTSSYMLRKPVKNLDRWKPLPFFFFLRSIEQQQQARTKEAASIFSLSLSLAPPARSCYLRMYDTYLGRSKVHLTAIARRLCAERWTDETTARWTRLQIDARDSSCDIRDRTPVVSRSPRAPDILFSIVSCQARAPIYL